MCNYHMSRNSTIHLSMQKSSASQIGKKSPPPPPLQYGTKPNMHTHLPSAATTPE